MALDGRDNDGHDGDKQQRAVQQEDPPEGRALAVGGKDVARGADRAIETARAGLPAAPCDLEEPPVVNWFSAFQTHGDYNSVNQCNHQEDRD